MLLVVTEYVTHALPLTNVISAHSAILKVNEKKPPGEMFSWDGFQNIFNNSGRNPVNIRRMNACTVN